MIQFERLLSMTPKQVVSIRVLIAVSSTLTLASGVIDVLGAMHNAVSAKRVAATATTPSGLTLLLCHQHPARSRPDRKLHSAVEMEGSCARGSHIAPHSWWPQSRQKADQHGAFARPA